MAVHLVRFQPELGQQRPDLGAVHFRNGSFKSITQRLEVAVMLRQKVTYQEIAQRTGASTATISRVNRSLQYGAEGYNLALDRLQASGLIPQKEEKDSNV